MQWPWADKCLLLPPATASRSSALAKVHRPWGQSRHQTQTGKTEVQLSALQSGLTPLENPSPHPQGSLGPGVCRPPALLPSGPSLNQPPSRSQP